MGGTGDMKVRVLLLVVLFVLSGAQPALANNPPGPQAGLAVILILPIMMGLSLLGGAYAVLVRLRGTRRRMPYILGAIVGVLIAAMHEGLAAAVGLIFGLIALIRGIRMIGWGWDTWMRQEPPHHLAAAHAWRLIPAGVFLVPVSLFLIGMPIAFGGYDPSPSFICQKQLIEFVADQLAYANAEQSTSGTRRFATMTNDDPEFCEKLSSACGRSSVGVEYGADAESFTVSMLASRRYPPFPYNYLTSQPAYRADETGEIRMAYVRHGERCPADAPVVWRVDPDRPETSVEAFTSTDRALSLPSVNPPSPSSD